MRDFWRSPAQWIIPKPNCKPPKNIFVKRLQSSRFTKNVYGFYRRDWELLNDGVGEEFVGDERAQAV